MIEDVQRSINHVGSSQEKTPRQHPAMRAVFFALNCYIIYAELDKAPQPIAVASELNPHGLLFCCVRFHSQVTR
jgi:hypothetical protein